MSAIGNFIRKLVLLASLMLALTGCVQYDTTINFQSFNTGQLVQHVTLDRQFYQLNHLALDTWLQSIEQRTQKLQGQIQRISDRELTVTIPFRTATELAIKFNQFFASDQQLLGSQLTVTNNNFLLASRHQLTYDLDLRSLAEDSPIASRNASPPANPLLPPETGKHLDLKFALRVPSFSGNRSGLWQLQPGQVNHLCSVFWLPNPIGIGGFIIILVVAIGYFIKSKLSPVLAKSA